MLRPLLDTALSPSSSAFVEKSQQMLTRLPAHTEDLNVSVTVMFGPRGGGLPKGKVAHRPLSVPELAPQAWWVQGCQTLAALGAGLVELEGFPSHVGIFRAPASGSRCVPLAP